MDTENRGWYKWGQDTKPQTENNRKDDIWKRAYHNHRALVNIKKIRQQDEKMQGQK